MADAKGAYIGGVPVQFKDAAARAMISDEYNSAETYAKGNLCIYNGKIYEAIKETTGTWDATAWEETTLAKVNGKLNGDIASLTENTIKEIITRTFSQEVTFVQGAGQSVNVPYTIPDGYDFLDVSKIYTNNVITSTCYQGHTTSNINLFSYAITGGNGTANVSILFKKL